MRIASNCWDTLLSMPRPVAAVTDRFASFIGSTRSRTELACPRAAPARRADQSKHAARPRRGRGVFVRATPTCFARPTTGSSVPPPERVVPAEPLKIPTPRRPTPCDRHRHRSGDRFSRRASGGGRSGAKANRVERSTNTLRSGADPCSRSDRRNFLRWRYQVEDKGSPAKRRIRGMPHRRTLWTTADPTRPMAIPPPRTRGPTAVRLPWERVIPRGNGSSDDSRGATSSTDAGGFASAGTLCVPGIGGDFVSVAGRVWRLRVWREQQGDAGGEPGNVRGGEQGNGFGSEPAAELVPRREVEDESIAIRLRAADGAGAGDGGGGGSRRPGQPQPAPRRAGRERRRSGTAPLGRGLCAGNAAGSRRCAHPRSRAPRPGGKRPSRGGGNRLRKQRR